MNTTPGEADFVRALDQTEEYLYRYWKIAKRQREDLARELAREGVTQAVASLSKFKGKSTLKTYFIRVGINRGNRALRKEIREEQIQARAAELREAVMLRIRCGRRPTKKGSD